VGVSVGVSGGVSISQIFKNLKNHKNIKNEKEMEDYLKIMEWMGMFLPNFRLAVMTR
jgi:cell division protein YceG involved in septum cleavage